MLDLLMEQEDKKISYQELKRRAEHRIKWTSLRAEHARGRWWYKTMVYIYRSVCRRPDGQIRTFPRRACWRVEWCCLVMEDCRMRWRCCRSSTSRDRDVIVAPAELLWRPDDATASLQVAARTW